MKALRWPAIFELFRIVAHPVIHFNLKVLLEVATRDFKRLKRTRGARIDLRNEAREAHPHGMVWELWIRTGYPSGAAKGIANRHAISRRPIAAKLGEVPHVMDIGLRPDKDPAFNIKVYPNA